MRWAACAAALLAGAVLVAGCGDDEGSAGPDGPSVTLHVTREFGREDVIAEERVALPERPTVLNVLRENAEVETSDGGSSIQSIDGARRAGDETSESVTTWALIVNGIEADLPPNEYRLHPGDVVQLDLRDWYVTLDVRATVGAFPETFTRGAFGRRFPTTLECARPGSAACRHVRGALERAGVDVDGSRPAGRRPPDGAVRRARVLVGPWKAWRDRPRPGRIDKGARYSGVFAKFSDSADAIRLLDWDARTTSRVGAGSGLVAAERPSEEDLLWIVTGVDEEGVERAARAVGGADLRGAFALVVTRDGAEKVPVPLADPSGPRDREGS